MFFVIVQNGKECNSNPVYGGSSNTRCPLGGSNIL